MNGGNANGNTKFPHLSKLASLLPLYVISMALTVASDAYGGQTNSAAPDTAPLIVTNNTPPAPNQTEITTLNGTTYKSVRILKVEPDGLMIQYSPQAGGIGLGKIPFENLSAEFHQKYGYDAQKASEYKAAQAAGEARWLKQMQTHQAQTWAAERERAEDNFKGRQEIEKLETQRRQAEAARIQAENERVRMEQEAERRRKEELNAIANANAAAAYQSYQLNKIQSDLEKIRRTQLYGW